jgi:feruloyl esterase
VSATLRPSRDSDIKIEVWLPEANWNGKLQSVGNGAWAGSISYSAMVGALAQGYAAASTDTGHEGNTSAFAIGRPEKLVDFAHRAIHEMTVAAKALIAARYESPPRRSYFVGCSTGGRQALAEAQRYPGDYDGIVAGAPAHHPSHLQGAQIWTALLGHDSAGGALTAEQLPLINAAVIEACDTLDGVADGVIENPRQCAFDPATLLCPAGAAGGTGVCLSPQQVETVRKIYVGPATASGETLFPGVARGSELGWNDRVAGAPISLAVETYRDLVFADPDWDFRSFDAERDMPRAHAAIGALMNSTDPDLEPFLSHGGKLLLYHGWNDSGIPPLASVDYYDSILETVDPSLADGGVRLFMVPGMNHCGGGVGTDRFDAAAAIDRWVTTGEAPERIEAAREEAGRTLRTRPLCPYPAVAVYTGAGSTDDADNFVCRK